jgi:transposase
MARPFKLEVQESEAELKHRLQHAGHVSETAKLQMLWWVKSGQVTQQQEIAARLGRDTSTITRWIQKYRAGGLGELLRINTAPGAKPSLSEEVVEQLKEQLNHPKGFSSYGEIVEWLKIHHGLEVTYATVYRWVRYRLGAKLKVPRPKSDQQDPEAVERFKKNLVQPYIA